MHQTFWVNVACLLMVRCYGRRQGEQGSARLQHRLLRFGPAALRYEGWGGCMAGHSLSEWHRDLAHGSQYHSGLACHPRPSLPLGKADPDPFAFRLSHLERVEHRTWRESRRLSIRRSDFYS